MTSFFRQLIEVPGMFALALAAAFGFSQELYAADGSSDAATVSMVALGMLLVSSTVVGLVLLLKKTRGRVQQLEKLQQLGPLSQIPITGMGAAVLNESWAAVLREMTLAGHQVFYELDAQYRYREFYPREGAFSDFNFDVLRGKTPWEHPSIGITAAQWSELQTTMQLRRPVRDFPLGRIDVNGYISYGMMTAVPMFDEGGNFTGYRGGTRDVTEVRKLQVQLEIKDSVTRVLSQNHRLSEAMPALLEAICKPMGWLFGARWMRDPRDGMLVCGEIWHAPVAQPMADVSRRARFPSDRNTGLLSSAWASKTIHWINDVQAETTFRRQEAVRESGLHAAFALPIVVQGDVVCLLEFFGPHLQRMDAFIDSVGQSVNGQISLFWLRREAEARLTFAATHDALTGLRNRLAFNAELDKAISRAARNEWRLAVLFLDLDGFKQVNDGLGHQAGDAILMETAKRLKAALRASDTVARIGGDEFVVLLEQAGEDGKIAEVAHKLARRLSEPHPQYGTSAPISASVGVSIYPVDGDDGQTLLTNADSAMYKAKELSGARVVFYRPPPEDRVTYQRAPVEETPAFPTLPPPDAVDLERAIADAEAKMEEQLERSRPL